MSSRRVATEIISQWLVSGAYPNLLLQTVQKNRPFVTEITLGVVRRVRTLEWALEKHMHHLPKGNLKACLLVGAYQIFFMTTVAEYAIVNETVEVVNTLVGPRSRGVVNAVLRNMIRHKALLCKELQKEPLAIRESHPNVLVNRWVAHFGEETTTLICRWNNQPQKITIRVNTLRTNVSEYMAVLSAAGIRSQPHPTAPNLYITLEFGINPAQLPGYEHGFFIVQNPAAWNVINFLNAQPGELVLDACAAPGGKTACIAMAMENKGTLVAMDKDGYRLKKIKETLQRMSLDALIVCGDVRVINTQKFVNGKFFDRILLDVPCTNTGVLNKRPDARWRFSRKRLQSLVTQQKGILENAGKALRPGGCMVYSTCSIEPEEGEELIKSWCKMHAGFQLEEVILLTPPNSMTDGMFAARISRI